VGPPRYSLDVCTSGGSRMTGSYHLHHVASTVAVEHLDQLRRGSDAWRMWDERQRRIDQIRRDAG
jgi:hypothetical protein